MAPVALLDRRPGRRAGGGVRRLRHVRRLRGRRNVWRLRSRVARRASPDRHHVVAQPAVPDDLRRPGRADLRRHGRGDRSGHAHSLAGPGDRTDGGRDGRHHRRRFTRRTAMAGGAVRCGSVVRPVVDRPRRSCGQRTVGSDRRRGRRSRRVDHDGRRVGRGCRPGQPTPRGDRRQRAVVARSAGRCHRPTRRRSCGRSLRGPVDPARSVASLAHGRPRRVQRRVVDDHRSAHTDRKPTGDGDRCEAGDRHGEGAARRHPAVDHAWADPAQQQPGRDRLRASRGQDPRQCSGRHHVRRRADGRLRCGHRPWDRHDPADRDRELVLDAGEDDGPDRHPRREGGPAGGLPARPLHSTTRRHPVACRRTWSTAS